MHVSRADSSPLSTTFRHTCVQYGICGAVAVEEYATGVIKRHEKTQVKKENDRTRLTFTQVRTTSERASAIYIIRQQGIEDGFSLI